MVEVMVVEPDEGMCMQCKATKKKLDSFGIPFISKKASTEDKLIKELGVAQAPLVVVRKDGVQENFWTGFRPDNIKSLGKIMGLVPA